MCMYINTLVLCNAVGGAWSERHCYGGGASVAKQLGGWVASQRSQLQQGRWIGSEGSFP